VELHHHPRRRSRRPCSPTTSTTTSAGRSPATRRAARGSAASPCARRRRARWPSPARASAGPAATSPARTRTASPTRQDVAGGSTILTSPAFDLGGAAAATVQLGASSTSPTPARGRAAVDLLVPDGRTPGEYDAHPLELLAAPTTEPPRTCGAARVRGLRAAAGRRLAPADLRDRRGPGLLEAAIDSVKVRAHDDATVCGAGEGGACDPDAGPAACPGDLLCCSQGVINEGIYRCAPRCRASTSRPPPTRTARQRPAGVRRPRSDRRQPSGSTPSSRRSS
jgi:hypothetical protein